MAFTVNSIMSGVMNNPDVAVVGLAAGFTCKKAMSYRKKRNNGIGGAF